MAAALPSSSSFLYVGGRRMQLRFFCDNVSAVDNTHCMVAENSAMTCSCRTYSHQSSCKKILFPPLKCTKKDRPVDPLPIEPPPYSSYMDSTTGEIEPAFGARARIPEKEYWPEGTIDRVRAGRAPEPAGISKGKSSFGKNPGSRRKKSKVQMVDGESAEEVAETADAVAETYDSTSDDSKDLSVEYVSYETKFVKENGTEYQINKKHGLPHPFIDPDKKRSTEDPLSSDDIWWNWRKPDKEQWSRWHRRRPSVERAFIKAMVETGQIEMYGDEPTIAETSLYRARRQVFKEERLQAEKERLDEIGPIAYYSEWVKAWNRDTSHEAVQKHYEQTGEDENSQLQAMFQYQTAAEYRIMMGTDFRIRRDPLVMRMREDQKKEVFGGDPVYPTVNYIQDPNEVTDFRRSNFHEHIPHPVTYFMERGKMISTEELKKMLAKDETEEMQGTYSDLNEAMSKAVDIGDYDDNDSNTESNDKEKLSRGFSVLKSQSELSTSKDKAEKTDPMTVEKAVKDSENLTDFVMDFDVDDDE